MKKYAALFATCLFLGGGGLFLPGIYLQSFPQVTLTQLAPKTYQQSVSASGQVEDPSQTEIRCSLPVVPEQVLVSVGDTVQAGQTIATVDFSETLSSLFRLLDLSQSVPEEAVSVMANLSSEELDAAGSLASLIPNQIVADQSGTVSALGISPGTICYPTDAAAYITSGGPYRAFLKVPEEYASSILPGQQVTLTASAVKDAKYTGTVSSISSSAQNVLSGTSQETVVGVYVKLDCQEQLKPGYSIRGKILTGKPETLAVLPYSAVGQDEQGQEYVYCYQDGKAVRKEVETGTEFAETVEIVSGISREDWVISDQNEIKMSQQRVLVSKSNEKE